MVEIREEKKNDYDSVRIVNDRAFGRPHEGRIVDNIRESCSETVSLVAVSDREIVGHIFFSPAIIEIPSGLIKGMGLGPLAVLPEFQNRGVGSMLVTESIRIMKKMEYPFVMVVGHENYYPRFGFGRASSHGLKSQWECVPDNVFMVMILDEPVMKDVSGTIRCRDEFDAAL
ncbi:N-acetyltransferase [bacterium]|nr:N-acetyltransferase [bacterium]